MANVSDTFYAGEAFIGYGAQLKVAQGDASPQTFVAVADIMSITPGDMTTGIINKTHLRSPGRAHEKMATLRDVGAFSFSGNYRPGHGSHSTAGGDGFSSAYSLVNLWRNVTENDFIITLIDANDDVIELPFRGVVSKYQIGEIGLETKVDFTAEIQPLSDWTASLP